LNLKERRAKKILKKLVDKEILEKIGKTKGSYYILKKYKGIKWI
jgi:predicted transcriptional regulator